MTKEEVLNTIIERYKRYKSQEDRNLLELVDCCYKIDCDNCPFQSSTDCSDAIAIELLDRLLKAEERPETNLEHYIDTYSVPLKDGDVPVIDFKDGWYEKFKVQDESLRKWLLSEYEEPKYKLSKFEYDLLDTFGNIYVPPASITNFESLKIMQDKGYFKGIPTDVRIEDILSNCEVIDGEQKQN